MRFLVTGATGQLGHDVVNELKKRGHTAIGVGSALMDITNSEICRQVITESGVDGVFHCGAYTAVDAAEDDRDKCIKVNADGTRNIARVCKDLDIKMIYISTDYVFNGTGERSWEPDDEREPLNIYGYSKFLGENAVTELLEKYFIVRISWVFGINGKNFVKTMLRLGKEKDALSVVNDQIGSPTYTSDLAVLLADMIETEKYGIYHASNEGFCSWYDFACEIFRQTGLDVKVTPVSSDAFPAKAKRPSNSRLNKDKLAESGFAPLPSWQDALSRYLKELQVV